MLKVTDVPMSLPDDCLREIALLYLDDQYTTEIERYLTSAAGDKREGIIEGYTHLLEHDNAIIRQAVAKVLGVLMVSRHPTQHHTFITTTADRDAPARTGAHAPTRHRHQRALAVRLHLRAHPAASTAQCLQVVITSYSAFLTHKSPLYKAHSNRPQPTRHSFTVCSVMKPTQIHSSTQGVSLFLSFFLGGISGFESEN